MVRYPHILVVGPQAESSQDTNGNWQTPASEEEVEEHACRAQPNSQLGNGLVATADGGNLNYSYKVYTQAKPGLQFGQKVIVKDDYNVIITDTVKQYFERQQHTEIWL